MSKRVQSQGSPVKITYPWFRSRGGPTPSVLWVCTGCGEAFWAPELGDRRYSCLRVDCPKHRVQSAIRRATEVETKEAEKHVRVG